MASVAETRAQLDLANVKIAEAMTAAQSAAGLYAEAHAILTGLVGARSADVGSGAVDIARDQCEQAFVRGHAAIEQIATYGATL